MLTDIISEIADALVDHRDAIALLSIDKKTLVALKTQRESRLRRMRFDQARNAVAPLVKRKYESYVIEAGAVVYCIWIDIKHFARCVLTHDLFSMRIIKDVTTLTLHPNIRENMPNAYFYICGKSGYRISKRMDVPNADTVSDHCFHGGNMTTTRSAFARFTTQQQQQQVHESSTSS
jgi:hypothetical protein